MPSPQQRFFQPWSQHVTSDLRKRAGIKPLAMIPFSKWVKRGRNGEFTTGFGGEMVKTDDQPRINWIGVTANACERVGIAGIRATYVHDNLDSTHGALHHGYYLCLWEQVMAHSGRHATVSVAP